MEQQPQEVPVIKQASIMEALTKAVSEVPDTKRGSFTAKVTTNGAEATLAYRYKDLESGLFVRRSVKGHVEVGGQIRWEW